MKKNSMNTEKVMLVVLVALILVSGVQGYQLNELREDIGEDRVGPVASSGDSAGGSAPTTSARSLNDLPQMVGGC